MDFDLQVRSVANAIWAEKKAATVVGQRVPLFEYLKSKGIKPWNGSGHTINEPVLTSINKNKVKGIGRFGELFIQPEDGQLVIPFTPKTITNTMVVDKNDVEACSGEAEQTDLVAGVQEQAMIEISESMEEFLVDDGTAQDGKVILGLDALIPDDPTTGTLCGYDRSTTSWMRTQAVSGAKDSVPYDKLKWATERCYNLCSRGTIRPELAPTGLTIFEKFKELFEDKHMYQNQKDANWGFEGVKFRNALVTYLDVLGTDYDGLFMLTRDALHLRAKMTNGSPFRTTPWADQEKITKALTLTAAIVFRGALTMSRPRNLGKVINIS